MRWKAVDKLEYYTRLPYHIRIVRDQSEDGSQAGWVAWVEELPGCASQGETIEEAATMIREAMEAWLMTAIDLGYEIPEPAPALEVSKSA